MKRAAIVIAVLGMCALGAVAQDKAGNTERACRQAAAAAALRRESGHQRRRRSRSLTLTKRHDR